MSVTYTCPNPACGATLRTANPVPEGKAVPCPKCKQRFLPIPDDDPPAAGPGTFKFADDEPTKKPKVNIVSKGKSPPPPAAPPPPPPPPPSRFAMDDEDEASIKAGYGVVRETEEELAAAEKNKPKFTDVEEKFKRSARGPAIALLVTAANIMVGVGLLVAAVGLLVFVWGMWPTVFNDAPLGEEELEDAIVRMLIGGMIFVWAIIVCLGASMMQELRSYTWSIIGAVMALPLLVGIYSLLMLQNPKVKAGFEESEGGPEEDDEDDDEDKKEDEDEDDDDDDDDD